MESGERDEDSPFNLKWVGGVARAGIDGTFGMSFGTYGAARQIEAPTTVSVFVRIAPGEWSEHVVPVDPSRTSSIAEHEMRLELGPVEINESITPYVD